MENKRQKMEKSFGEIVKDLCKKQWKTIVAGGMIIGGLTGIFSSNSGAEVSANNVTCHSPVSCWALTPQSSGAQVRGRVSGNGPGDLTARVTSFRIGNVSVGQGALVHGSSGVTAVSPWLTAPNNSSNVATNGFVVQGH